MVKAYFTGDTVEVEIEQSTAETEELLHLSAPVTSFLDIPLRRGSGRPRKHPPTANTIESDDEDGPVFGIFLMEPPPQHDTQYETELELPFTASRLREVQGLVDNGVFETITSAPPGVRIFGARFAELSTICLVSLQTPA